MRIKLENVCKRGSSNLRQSDVEGKTGEYPIFGAAGYIGNVDFYHQEESYIGVVKDGAGVGRVVKLPAKSSVIGTMQYIIPNSDVDVSYLAYAMEHMNLAKYYSGATIPHIYFKDYCKETIPLHSAIEQRHIAAVLDKAAALIDLRKQQLAKLDELVKARFVEMFGDTFSNPKEWPTKTFREASIRLSDGPFGSNLKSEHYSDKGIRVIRLGNIGVGEFIDDDKSYISTEHYERLKKYTCKSGEIVIGTLGEPNLRACIVPEFVGIAVNKADCVHYIPNPDILDSIFVCQYINCPTTLLLASGMIHGQTRSRVSSGQIAEMPIYIPPIELQLEFARFIKRINKSKAAIQKALDEAQLLFDSLMQKYFG